MEHRHPSITEARGLIVIVGGIEENSGLDASHRKAEWQDGVRRQLSAIVALPDEWDGYGAGKIPTDTAQFAFQVLTEIWLPRLPLPDISPMSSEGVLVEWITDKYEFTLEVEAPYDVNLVFENRETGESEQGYISQDLRTIDKYILLLIDDMSGAVAA